MKYIVLEHHPNDKRVKIDTSGTIQTLTGRMGTGGGNVPLIIQRRFSGVNIKETETSFCLEAGAGSGGVISP